ncbi:hypothetical protein JHK85_006690 [Glycine max]|nr:hypothetical protein JHK85_006690 [Glycine max]KAG5071292.1 hypothetical protein JHK86_006503 [Glycine max]
MGNCSMKGTTGECHHSIRVMCDSGAFLQLKAPKTVAQVLQHYPGYGIFRQGHASAPLPEQQTGLKFAFTHFNTENEDGIKSKPYIFLLGLLMSQYTLIGYDASAPYEETNGADRNGPTRIISAVGISITVGWGYIIYIIFAITSIPYILSESNDAGGYAIAEMFYQAFKTRYGNGIGGIICLRAQQAMLVMKELARREATLGIVTMNLIIELRLQDQIRNGEKVLHGQRMNT